MANDLAPTPADVDLFLGSPAGVSQGVLDAAVAAVREHCRWHIAPVRTETFDRVDSDGRILRVPSLRLLDVLGVAERTDGVLGAPSTAGIEWSVAGLICRASGFAAGWGRWSVEVEHGFDVDDVSDVVMVVCQLATRMQRAVDAAAAGPTASVAEEQIGQYRYRLADNAVVAAGGGVGLTPAEERWIERRRLVVEP